MVTAIDPGRWLARVDQVERCQVERIVGRKPRCKQRPDEHDQHHQSSQHGDWRASELIAEIAIPKAIQPAAR